MTNSPSPTVPTRFDVVVFRTNDIYERERLVYMHPTIQSRFDLGHDLFIERIDDAVARKIAHSCNAGGAYEQVAQRYSFVRYFTDTDPKNFDEDQRLQIAIALSRLIHPTSIGLQQSAQVWGPINDESQIVVRPGPVHGPAAEPPVVDTEGPDWLIPADGMKLKELLDVYLAGNLPDRVRRAIRLHESAARSWDMAVRWTLVATALEALFNVTSDWVSLQFRERCQAVAAELGLEFSKKDASTAYGLRSKISHGALTGPDAKHRDLYVRMERVLRGTLVRALSDPTWADTFNDDAKLSARWPVNPPDLCSQCRQTLPAASV